MCFASCANHHVVQTVATHAGAADRPVTCYSLGAAPVIACDTAALSENLHHSADKGTLPGAEEAIEAA